MTPDQELQSVNAAISQVSSGDMGGQWACSENHSDVATHLLFLGFEGGQMKTLASTDDKQICGLGASEHMAAVHDALIPVIKAHFQAGGSH